jgi:hypothetical protein
VIVSEHRACQCELGDTTLQLGRGGLGQRLRERGERGEPVRVRGDDPVELPFAA